MDEREIADISEGSDEKFRRHFKKHVIADDPSGDDDEDSRSTVVKSTVSKGISFGSALAMIISFTTWKSVGWAIIHGLMSWVYVVYYVIRY